MLGEPAVRVLVIDAALQRDVVEVFELVADVAIFGGMGGFGGSIFDDVFGARRSGPSDTVRRGDPELLVKGLYRPLRGIPAQDEGWDAVETEVKVTFAQFPFWKR